MKGETKQKKESILSISKRHYIILYAIKCAMITKCQPIMLLFAVKIFARWKFMENRDTLKKTQKHQYAFVSMAKLTQKIKSNISLHKIIWQAAAAGIQLHRPCDNVIPSTKTRQHTQRQQQQH